MYGLNVLLLLVLVNGFVIYMTRVLFNFKLHRKILFTTMPVISTK